MKLRYQIITEIIWWIIAILCGTAISFPIFSKINYSFLFVNFLLIMGVVLYFRYSFFFYQIPWLKPLWVRFILVLISLNLFIFVVRQFQYFISVYDSFLIEEIGKPIKPLTGLQVENLFKYFYIEITFSTVALLALIVLFVGRSVMSYWKLAKTRLVDNNQIEK